MAMDWTPYAVGGAAARADSFTGLNPEFAGNVYRMVQGAHEAGIPLQITSAYRSPEVQARLFDAAVKKYGSPEAARKWVAPPGRSRHNTGTAVDFAVNGGLLRDANSPAAKWVAENAANYGLSVPMSWEPWQVEPAGSRSKPLGASPAPRVSTKGGAPIMEQPQENTPKWKNPDLWANLAIAFNSMRMRPDAVLAQAMRSGIESRAGKRKAAQNRNKTADWLESQGAAELAAGVRSGAIPATTGLSMYQVQAKAASNPNVQTSQMLPDASGSVLTMRDGSLRVVTSGGETLTGQEAMDFVRQAQERGVQYEREKFGARRQGTLGADIEMGSEAEAAKAWGKEAPKVVGEFAERAGLVRSNISNIDDAIAAIDEGAESGIVYNMLPNITEASASLNNAMNRMGLDVIGSVTFGALSEGEMRLAMETAVPRNLSPTELRSWLVKKREAQAKAYAALNEAIQFIASGRSPAEYYATFGAGEGAKPKQAAPSSGDLSDEDLLKKYGG